MADLWAVHGDPNNHSGCGLDAPDPKTVYVEGINVTHIKTNGQAPDGFLHPTPHTSGCGTSGGAPNVYVYGEKVHRVNDNRGCGAFTASSSQSTVYVGDN